ncbi:MAG: DUF4124 domain-containing protein, partial [Planctomycetaceae bacterium]
MTRLNAIELTADQRYATILLLFLSLVGLLAILLTSPCSAQIYKYQKNGIWYYTDAPPADMPPDSQQVIESTSPSPRPPADGRLLLDNYAARNAIERAVAGTIAIKSPLGYGSGFFITPHGHIITNKHVIRSTNQMTEQNETQFRQVEERIDQIEKQFADEAQRLFNFKARLEQLKTAAEQESNLQRKQAYLEDYKENTNSYQKWHADYDSRRKQFESEKNAFHSGRAGYDYSKSVADLAQSFTIVLADNTEFYV